MNCLRRIRGDTDAADWQLIEAYGQPIGFMCPECDRPPDPTEGHWADPRRIMRHQAAHEL